MRIGECLEFGWQVFRRHTASLVFTSLALLVAWAILCAVLGSVLGPLLGLLSWAFTGFFSGGFIQVARRAALGQDPTLDDAFAPFRVRQGDYVLVGLASAVGALLCGIGVIVTSCLFLFAPLFVGEGLDYKQALMRSKDLVLANLADAVLLSVVLFALNIAGALACGVGLLATAPISALAILKASQLAEPVPALPADTASGPGAAPSA